MERRVDGQASTRFWPGLAAQGLLAAVYFFAGKFGLSLAFWHVSATAVWPPTGIALTALLFWGTRLWPAIFLGAFLVNLTTEGTLVTSLGIAAGNTLEAVAGAWLVRRFAGGREAFHRVHTLVSFVILAGLVSTTISATMGVTSLALGGFLSWARYGAIWFTWWLGDVVSNLTIAPLLIIWMSRPRLPFRLRQAVEIAAVLLVIIVIGQWVFGGWGVSAGQLPVEFVTIPVLLWTAFRLGLRVTVTAAALLSWLALRGTLHGLGPFATADANASLLLLQAFMGVVTMTALTLAAAIAERKRAEEALRQAHDELENRVLMRTSELQQALEELKYSNEEQKTAYLQLIQAAKMESIGRLAAGVAHEVKNPLAIILQGIDFLSKRLSDQDGNTALVLQYTSDAVRRADAVIRGLLDFSTSGKLELIPSDFNEVIEHAVLLVKHELDRSHVQVVKTLAPELPPVPIDRNKMEQVFVNLFLNAISAMPSGGTLTISTQAKRLDTIGPQVGLRMADRFRLGDTVMVAEVSDTGSGIPEDAIPKIFDPFFTTKPRGQGTGLGLTVTKKIIELHSGLIEIRNEPEGGVKVTLALRVKGGERVWRKSASFSLMTK